MLNHKLKSSFNTFKCLLKLNYSLGKKPCSRSGNYYGLEIELFKFIVELIANPEILKSKSK